MCYTTKEQTIKQRIILLRTLLLTQKGKEFDPITASRFVRDTYGLDYDWHEYSLVLDGMKINGLCTFTGFTGERMTKYVIN